MRYSFSQESTARSGSIELIKTIAAFAALLHQTSATQQAKMLGDGGAGYRESAGNLPCGEAATAQQVEHGAAGGIGNSAERGLRGICNRSATHNV